MNEQWMSIVEYARTFSISDITIRRRIRTGKLNAVLKEGKYYIPVSDQKLKSLQAKHLSTVLEDVQTVRHTPAPAPHVIPKQIQTPRPSHEINPPVPYSHQMQSEMIQTQELKKFFDSYERSFRYNTDSVRILEENYLLKEKLLKEDIRMKELEIHNLKQQVEDLTVLTKLLERDL